MLTENRQVVADNHLKLCKFDKMFLNEGLPQYFDKINFLICCFQSVKDIKFESNSQHAVSVSEELP